MAWYWTCNGEDNRHGCFDADCEGRCTTKARKPFTTKEAAETAGKKHELKCRFHGPTHTYNKRRVSN